MYVSYVTIVVCVVSLQQYEIKGWPLPTIMIHNQLSDVIVIDNLGPLAVKQVKHKIVIIV